TPPPELIPFAILKFRSMENFGSFAALLTAVQAYVPCQRPSGDGTAGEPAAAVCDPSVSVTVKSPRVEEEEKLSVTFLLATRPVTVVRPRKCDCDSIRNGHFRSPCPLISPVGEIVTGIDGEVHPAMLIVKKPCPFLIVSPIVLRHGPVV